MARVRFTKVRVYITRVGITLMVNGCNKVIRVKVGK